MLSSIYEKFHNVQDGISSSFKGLAVGQPLPGVERASDSGCALLARYQDDWQMIHTGNEVNAVLAREVDEKIEKLYMALLKRKKVWENFSRNASNIESLITETEKVVNAVGRLRMDSAALEEDLCNLENLIETQELEQRKILEKQKLSLYREKRLTDLDKIRAEQSARHEEKLKKREMLENTVNTVKSEMYQERFERDMEQYKVTGVLPAKGKFKPMITLFSIFLEGSEPNLSSLDDIKIEDDSEELAKYLDS